MFDYDEKNLAKVARIVSRLNPSQLDRPVELIRQEMMYHAEQVLRDGNGYVAISGWCLSAYRKPDGGIWLHASIHDCLYND